MATVVEHTLELAPGDNLNRDEFLRRWERHPEIKRAELIGGVVYMPSPVSIEHGALESEVGTWLGTYQAYTPGCASGHNATTMLLEEDTPQPDLHLRILPECGGMSRVDGDYLGGPPEFIAEICRSSAVYDLHQKLELYEEAGVPEYLAVLVREREIRWHILKGGSYELLNPATGRLWKSNVFPGLWLDGKALLARDMTRVLATLQKGIETPEHAEFVRKLAREKSRRKKVKGRS